MKVKDIKQIMKKNILVIAIFFIVGALAGGTYAKLKRKTTFTAQTNILVGHNLDHTNHRNSTVLADLNMIDSYKELVEDRQVMNKAHSLLPKKLRKDYSAEKISKVVDVDKRQQSLVLKIKAVTSSPKDSTKIANAVSKAAKEELPKIDPGMGRVQRLAPAKEKNVNSKTSPSMKKFTVLGAALGLLVGMIISFSLTTWRKLV